MTKHYTIEGTTIYADILALNEKEEAEDISRSELDEENWGTESRAENL